MEVGRTFKQAPELVSHGKPSNQTDRSFMNNNVDEITRKLRDVPWLLTDAQLTRTSLSKLSKGIGAMPPRIIFDAYLRWLELQRTAPKNNFNGDWAGVIAQWTQSLRARGFSLDELIKVVLEWMDSHDIANKFIKELDDCKADGRASVKPRQPPTATMLEKGWARVLEGAAGVKAQTVVTSRAGGSCKSSITCTKQVPTGPARDSGSKKMVLQPPTADLYRPPITNVKWEAAVGPGGDSNRPSTEGAKQQIFVRPVLDSGQPLTTSDNPTASGTSAVDSYKPSTTEIKRRTPTGFRDDSCSAIPVNCRQAFGDPTSDPYNFSASSPGRWIHDKYQIEVACFDEPKSGPVKPLTVVPRTYICNRCKEPGHHVADCPTNMDPSYDHAPDMSYVCTFCKMAGVHFNLFCPKNRTPNSVYRLRLAESIIDKSGAPIRQALERPRITEQHMGSEYSQVQESHHGESPGTSGLYRSLKRSCGWEVPIQNLSTLNDDESFRHLFSSEESFEDFTKARRLALREMLDHKVHTTDVIESSDVITDRFSALLSKLGGGDESQMDKFGEMIWEKLPGQNITTPSCDLEVHLSGYGEFLRDLFKNHPSQATNKRRPRLTALNMWEISDANKERETMNDDLDHSEAIHCKEPTGEYNSNKRPKNIADQVSKCLSAIEEIEAS